jgi:hypothetical protein
VLLSKGNHQLLRVLILPLVLLLLLLLLGK